MGKLVIEGFMATTDKLEVYSGVAIPRQLIEDLARSLKRDLKGLTVVHDERRRIPARVVDVDVRETETGSVGVWVKLEIEEEEAKKFNGFGFSIAVIRPLIQSAVENTRPSLKVAADGAHFDENTLREAAALLNSHFSVEAGVLYQFDVAPPAKVVIEMLMVGLQTVPWNLASAVVYDGLKQFLKPKHSPKSVFSFHVRDSKGDIHCHLETSDAEILKEAISSFRDVALSGRGEGYEFNNKERHWEKYR